MCSIAADRLCTIAADHCAVMGDDRQTGPLPAYQLAVPLQDGLGPDKQHGARQLAP